MSAKTALVYRMIKERGIEGIGADEAIIINYSAPVIPSSVVLGLSNFKRNDSFILTIDSLRVSDDILKMMRDSFEYTNKNEGN